MRYPRRGGAVAGVEGRLTTADLSVRKDNLVSRLTEQRLGVRHSLGQDQVAEAGGEELNLQPVRPSR